MRRWHHWPPKRGEPIRSQERSDIGLREDGKILFVDRETEDVLVGWSGRKIVKVVNCFEWQGHTVTSMHYMVDNVWYPPIIVTMQPWLLLPGGETSSYSFDDLQGNWISAEGGEGIWYVA